MAAKDHQWNFCFTWYRDRGCSSDRDLVHPVPYFHGISYPCYGIQSGCSGNVGINPKTQCMLAFFISGAVAGLAGFTEINGMQHMLLTGLESDIGSYGIGIAIMANANPIGVIFAALLFGTLQVGGTALGHSTDAPASVIDVMLGFVMLFVLMSFFVRKKLEVRSMKKQKTRKERFEYADFCEFDYKSYFYEYASCSGRIR